MKLPEEIKKVTDYLVVGIRGSDGWITGNYGGKVQKAAAFQDEGQNIRIYKEEVFIPSIQYLLEHPDEHVCGEETTSVYDWKSSVQTMLDEIVKKEELPANSLFLMENTDRDGNKTTSCSVCIYEPDYPLISDAKEDPMRNSIVINIKEKKSSLELIVDKKRFYKIGAPTGAEIKDLKSDKDNVHVIFPADSSVLIDYLKKNTKYVYANYVSKAASFGCCSQYVSCSDAKKCIHENKLYSKACIYRKQLEAGNIFYGKNRNVQ